MTDEQIIKALGFCSSEHLGCEDGCPYTAREYKGDLCSIHLKKDALALINRQKTEIDILIRKKEALRDEIAELQAEIERLRAENNALDGANVLLTVTLHNTRAEAFKEFAERLKENEIDIDVSYGFGREHYTKAVATIVIDNLVKELTEGQR